jgi:drug/metabolite transporter (DMT)-like permease
MRCDATKLQRWCANLAFQADFDEKSHIEHALSMRLSSHFWPEMRMDSAWPLTEFCACTPALRLPLMSATALALVIAAAIMHATWNLAAKKAQGGQLFLVLCSLSTLVIYALPVAWVVARDGLPTGTAAWVAMAASGALHLVYFTVLQKGYRAADLSVVYPVARGTGPLITIAVAIAVLGERPSTQALAGAAVVIGGVFLLAGGAKLLTSHDPRAKAGLFWGSLTGLFIASYTVVDGYAVRVLLVAPLVLDYISHVMRAALSGPHALMNLPALKAEWLRTWKHVLVISTIGPLGYILVLTAMQYAPISYVAPARELSMLIGAFFGAKLLKEGDLRQRLLCAGLIAGGVGLIATG